MLGIDLKCKHLLFSLLVLFSSVGAHTITETTLHNEEDFVANLSDGSSWKIHPKDRETYAQWSLDDEIENGVSKAIKSF